MKSVCDLRLAEYLKTETTQNENVFIFFLCLVINQNHELALVKLIANRDTLNRSKKYYYNSTIYVKLAFEYVNNRSNRKNIAA